MHDERKEEMREAVKESSNLADTFFQLVSWRRCHDRCNDSILHFDTFDRYMYLNYMKFTTLINRFRF